MIIILFLGILLHSKFCMKHNIGDALRFWQRTLNVIDNTQKHEQVEEIQNDNKEELKDNTEQAEDKDFEKSQLFESSISWNQKERGKRKKMLKLLYTNSLFFC